MTEDDVPRRDEAALQVVRRFLRETWDPVGVGDLPQCHDAHDSSAAGLATMLTRGAAEAAIEHRPIDVLGRMGLDRNPLQRERVPAIRAALVDAAAGAQREAGP